jgi:glycosidase
MKIDGRSRRPGLLAALGAYLLLSACAAAPAAVNPLPDGLQPSQPEPANSEPRLARLPQDEVIYFVLPDRFENGDPSNDRGGIEGGRLDHGFDPTHRGFYHGGDLRGLIDRLDYIEGLGVTAIWLGPIYRNKPVQGPPGNESAGYHGYWILDFTRPDPHFGTEADLAEFVAAVHARGMKLYLDIITNHTADVIKYRECLGLESTSGRPGDDCPYRSIADYPYTTRGGPDGEPINQGFMGDRVPFQTRENFEKLTRTDYAYTPFVPEGEEDVKVPAWLNDMRYYHNRGHTSFEGESSLYGDFAGLDDLFTANPDVLGGFIDIYKDWITKYRIDGFRIDTAKHVNPEFWHAFNPAMIEHARALGIPNFYIFGEVYDPSPDGLAVFTRTGGFPTVLDFAFQSAVEDVLVGMQPAARLERLFRADAIYAEGAAAMAPTFIGNHDMGRFSGFLRAAHPDMTDDEMLKRVSLAHALMFFARGVPVIYYGDEQGFVSSGNDQLARENMFPSRVPEYIAAPMIGTSRTAADSNFETEHPLYLAIADMAATYRAHAGLRRGEQVTRLAETDGGIFAFSRLDTGAGEYVVVINMRDEARQVNISIDPRSREFAAIHGVCPSRPSAPGVIGLELEPLAFVICRAGGWKD